MQRGQRTGKRSRTPFVESSRNANPEDAVFIQHMVQMFRRQIREENEEGIAQRTNIVREAIDLGVRRFGGSINPLECIAWLKETNQILTEGIICTDEEKIRAAGFMLNDDARVWFDNAKATIGTWQRFQDAFREHFCPQAFLNSKRVEFERLQQGDMTIAQYEAKFKELCEYVPHMVPNDEAKRMKFIEGLRVEYNGPMSAVPYPSYAACRSAALEMERMSQLRLESKDKQKKRQTNADYGFSSPGSSKKGNYSSESSKGNNNDSLIRRRGRNSKENRLHFGGNTQSTSQDTNDRTSNRRCTRKPCEICGNYHSGECKVLIRQSCFKCGHQGHFIRDCPYADQDESGNQSENLSEYV